ncbi:MAG TPA: leucyl aminopeptidase family protein [Bacteroidales bacterium]|nr:leucyl aminopeptidase family protein [Bacteroidales bacterium]
MEILTDKPTTKVKYAVEIFLIADFEDISNIAVSSDVRDMCTKKYERKKSDIVWVETPDVVYMFCKTYSDQNPEEFDKNRQNGAKLYTSCKIFKDQHIRITNNSAVPHSAFACIEGFILSSYTFSKYKSEQAPQSIASIQCEGDFTSSLAQLHTLTLSVFAARNLINEPACALTSVQFAHEIEQLFSTTKASVNVYDEQWITQQGMGGLLAVNKGSVQPARFVHIAWNPTNSNTQPIILVGKGIVFDTGGLSIKTPSTYMETMKADMGGAAAVVGAMHAIATQGIAIHIHALIPITDNRPSGEAYAPGDVIRMHNGSTVEVLNTDAEGRMILADALSYAASLNPQLVIDIATLTGAANAAVGEHVAVYMGTATDHMKQLEQSALHVWEPLVQFPLWNMYADQIKSDIADCKNVGGQFAGAITAGKFLQQFVQYPWIHIDISGSAFLRTKWSYKGVGGTGFGVRMLVEFVKGLV